MRVRIDSARCVHTGNCTILCPEVFASEGRTTTIRRSPVPREYEQACRRAENGCPTRAITLEE